MVITILTSSANVAASSIKGKIDRNIVRISGRRIRISLRPVIGALAIDILGCGENGFKCVLGNEAKAV